MTANIIDNARWSVSEGWLLADGIRQVKIDTIDKCLMTWDKKRKAWVKLSWHELNTLWTVT